MKYNYFNKCEGEKFQFYEYFSLLRKIFRKSLLKINILEGNLFKT